MIFKAFISSQFSYCPLVWMFHKRELNNRINRLHERSLRLVYQEQSSLLSFEELLLIDKSVTIHQRNLQFLAIEIFKMVNGLSPKIMDDVLQVVKPAYELRNTSILRKFNVKTVQYGTESIYFLAPKIWDLVPTHIKCETKLESFKIKIKSWKCIDCPCRLCKTYIGQVGFI